MGTYDQINKVKEKYEKQLNDANAKIDDLTTKLAKANQEIDDYRRKLYEVGEGKGEVNKAKKEIHGMKVEMKTMENKLKEIDGSKMISQFSPKRKELIEKINNLKFENKIFNSFAVKFQSGLKDVIQIAYRIKIGSADDMDFYTFVFRDNIVGLFDKMLHIVTGGKADSATKHIKSIIAKNYSFPKEYLTAIPALKDIDVLGNIIHLLNCQTISYHGSSSTIRNMVYNSETNDYEKSNKFLTLDTEKQLEAIFTLLEFMYYFFSSVDSEINLINLSSCWFKTID